ncbi:aspartate aminotransferase family protein [Dyella sp. 2HG41-7]|uniref:aspartate aminotransferase family protein n=1 Tax=Dyella sp. 2HG41-7 TaxID=2883239 RepID=UPI001F4559FF|nr:aspartate aminotransferase family protein [Dyella sp. 2HG41-7]
MNLTVVNEQILAQPKGDASTEDSALAYPVAALPKFVSAEGCYLVEANGMRYLDGCAGTFNVNLGYGHPAVTRAVSDVLSTGLLHLSSSFQHPEVEAAARALVDVAPRGLTHCHFKGSTGGSTAVEQAIRHAWAATGKRSLITFRAGHHGQTIATTSVSGMPFRCNRLPISPLPAVHVDPPDCYRCRWHREPNTCHLECIDAIEHAVDAAPTGENDTAAFVGEPILGAGGGIAPPKHWWAALHSRLRRRNVLLVLDEIQTFGRTGSFFAADYYDVEPDMIVVSKGISGIGVPGAAGVLMKEPLRQLNAGERSLTSASSVISMAAVRATVDVMRTPGFFESVRYVSEILAHRLQSLQRDFACVGVVRGFGLMTGIELVKDRTSKEPDVALAHRVVEECLKNGLLLRISMYDRGAFVKVRPPLVISEDEVHELCDVLGYSLRAACEA